MAFGDFVGKTSSTYANRTGAGTIVLNTPAVIDSNDIIVLIVVSATGIGSLITANETTPGNDQLTAGVAGTYCGSWYKVQAVAQGVTSYTVTYTNDIQWSYAVLLQFHGASATIYDSAAVAKNYYSEKPYLHARAFTTKPNCLAVAVGTQTYIGATDPSAVVMTDWTLLSNDGDSAGGGGAKPEGGVWSRVLTDYAFLSAIIDNSVAVGAGVDGDGFILPFTDDVFSIGIVGMDAITVSSTTPAAVNTEVASSSSGASTTSALTLNPAPIAGNLLVARMAWDAYPGAVSIDQFALDGWTLVDTWTTFRYYYKIATGTDDTSLGHTWATGGSWACVYAEFAIARSGDTTPIVTLTNNSVPGNYTVGTPLGTPDTRTPRPETLWIAGVDTAQGVGSPHPAPATDGVPGAWTQIVATAASGSTRRAEIHAMVAHTGGTRPRFACGPGAADNRSSSNVRDSMASVMLWRGYLPYGSWQQV